MTKAFKRIATLVRFTITLIFLWFFIYLGFIDNFYAFLFVIFFLHFFVVVVGMVAAVCTWFGLMVILL